MVGIIAVQIVSSLYAQLLYLFFFIRFRGMHSKNIPLLLTGRCHECSASPVTQHECNSGRKPLDKRSNTLPTFAYA